MNKSNLVLKHSTRRIYNVVRRLRVRDTSNSPGVLLNSLPKSGTHLIHPLLLSLGFNDYQGFFASTPPLTMRLRDTSEACAAVQRIMANELFSAHMFFDSAIERELIDTRTPSVFIYRDPRAVFVSELNYVQHMNRWHKYHGVLAGMDSEEGVFRLLLEGLPDADFFFPGFRERVRRYTGWIKSESTVAITFEDLLGADARPTCEQLSSYFATFGSRLSDESFASAQIHTLLSQLSSGDSHTYTGLDPDRWHYQLSKAQRSMLENELDDLLMTMGYSS